MPETSKYFNLALLCQKTFLPGCAGCYFKAYDGLCRHLELTGISRVKIGAKTGPNGGCRCYKPSGSRNKSRWSGLCPKN